MCFEILVMRLVLIFGVMVFCEIMESLMLFFCMVRVCMWVSGFLCGCILIFLCELMMLVVSRVFMMRMVVGMRIFFMVGFLLRDFVEVLVGRGRRGRGVGFFGR